MIHKVLDIIISGEDNLSGVQIYDVLMTPILLDSFCDDVICTVEIELINCTSGRKECARIIN